MNPVILAILAGGGLLAAIHFFKRAYKYQKDALEELGKCVDEALKSQSGTERQRKD